VVAAFLAGLVASVGAFLFARRRGAVTALSLAAALDTLCGLENVLLGSAHLAAVIGRALAGKGTRGAPTFHYDFSFYSLVLLGALLAAAGLVCLTAVKGLTRGDLPAWRRAFGASAFLLAINAPLAPIQSFAYVLGGLALANLAGLTASRRAVRSAG
jgi:hypothetical protein